jgi:hypothetical protein
MVLMRKPGAIYLTRSNSEFEAAAAKTHVGMMYFANTGPFGRTCKECTSYDQEDRLCLRYAKATGRMKSFPGSAAACRYFEAKRES